MEPAMLSNLLGFAEDISDRDRDPGTDDQVEARQDADERETYAVVDALLRDVPKARRRKRLRHEARHRAKAINRFAFEGHGLGTHRDQVLTELERLQEKRAGEVVVIPSWKNRKLVGGSGYLGADRPSPYLWASMIPTYLPKGGKLVWEVGATTWPSGGIIADRMGLKWETVWLPSSSSTEVRVRQPVGRRVEEPRPDLVLVWLPLPCDQWSIRQHHRLLRRQWEMGEDIWDFGELSSQEDLALAMQGHPEFAHDPETYISATLVRLGRLGEFVSSGTTFIVAVRNHLGVPQELRRRVRRELGWTKLGEHQVFEQGGQWHIGNGDPLDLLVVSAWRTP